MIFDRVLQWLPGTSAHARRRLVDDRLARLSAVLGAPASPVEDAVMRVTLAKILAREAGPADPPADERGEPAAGAARTRDFDLEPLVAEWARGICEVCCVLDSQAGLRDKLLGFAKELALRLLDPDMATLAPELVGRALAYDMHLTTRAFTATVRLLMPWAEQLQEFAGRNQPQLRAQVFADLSCGYAEGLRDRLFDEQLCTTTALQLVRTRRPATAVADPAPTGSAAPEPEPAGSEPAGSEPAGSESAGTEPVGTGLGETGLGGTGSTGVRQADGPPAEGTAEDATQRALWRQRLLRCAYRDEVTGLPNQRDFRERVTAALAAAGVDAAVALCAVRVGGLVSTINAFEPAVHDRVVADLACRVRGTTAGMRGVTVGRLDADTFAILVTNSTDWVSLHDLVKRLADWIAQPVRLDDRELVFAPWIGVVAGRAGRSSVESLLRQAEIALASNVQAAKQPWVVVDPGSVARDRQRRSLLMALPDALETGQVRLAFSPIARVTDGVIVGAEASPWWRHPEHGDVPVADLVALADEIGLTLPVGQWIIRAACAQAARWQHRLGARAPFVAVNVSQRASDDECLVHHVRTALRETHAPPAKLRLRMEEAGLFDRRGGWHNHLIELTGLNVRLEINNIGTRYARFDRLTSVPVYGIVVPPALVAKLGVAEEGNCTEAVAGSLVALGLRLNCEVTMQGVDGPRELGCVRQLGGQFAQGRGIGEPVGPDEFEKLVTCATGDVRRAC